MEYRFAALVVKILVVIRIRLGMTRPNPRRMTVRSLFCMAMAAMAPQTIIRMLPPRSPVRVAETAAFVSLAYRMISAIQVAVDRTHVPMTAVMPVNRGMSEDGT